MSEHTKGPWHRINSNNGTQFVMHEGGKDFTDVCDDTSVVCHITTNNHPNAFEDARLIAAAPELLEALEDCLYSLGDEFNLPGDVKEAARSALAKAKGDNQ